MPVNAGLQNNYLQFGLNATDLPANTSHVLVAPFDGWVEEIRSVVQAAVTTGGTIKVQINTVDVPGAVVTVANAAAKGVRAVGVATLRTATRKVLKGDLITIVPTGFATAGAVSGTVKFSASDISKVQPF